MAEKILIIDDDVDTLKLVGLMLQKQGFQIIASTNGEQGLIQAETENPDLIILDVMMPQMDGYEVARRLRSNPYLSNIPILMFTAKTQLDDKVVGFESGADDYLTKPTHPSELVAHVKALLARPTKKEATSAVTPVEKRAFTIGIMSARGGLGVTTVAANLGSAIHAAAHASVIVAELRPGMGTLGPEMGENNPTALTNLLQSNQADLTSQKIKDSLTTHESGLQLLFGSIQPKDAALLNSTVQFEILVNRLATITSYLILDFGAGLTPLTQKLSILCNQVIVVTEPNPNSLQHTRSFIADLRDIGNNVKKIQAVVVNRIRSDTQLTWMQAQEQLGHPVNVAITPAPELIYMAGRKNTTAVAFESTSLTGQQFNKLASQMLELEKQET